MSDERTSIFRKKTIESIQSPEVLDDYLKVTSPGVWIFLGAAICLLIGVIIWGVFGSINTTTKAAVVTSNGQSVCVVTYDKIDAVLNSGIVTVDGTDYEIAPTVYEPQTVTEQTDVYLRLAGGFTVGDVITPIAMKSTLGADGVKEGKVITEKLKPMSLLFN